MNEATVAVVVNKQTGHVLALQRRDVPIWVLPGGAIDNGETPEQSVLREIFEETGIRAEILRKVCVFQKGNRMTCATHLFECTPVGGKVIVSDEALDVRYIPHRDLEKIMLPIHYRWIDKALSGKSFDGPQKIEGASYWHLLYYIFRHPVLVARWFLSRIGLTINS